MGILKVDYWKLLESLSNPMWFSWEGEGNKKNTATQTSLGAGSASHSAYVLSRATATWKNSWHELWQQEQCQSPEG